MGRLFDGAAAILGMKDECNYEGQAAILLEAAAGSSEERLPIEFWKDGQEKLLRLDWRPMIREMVRRKEEGRPTAELAAAFMNSLIDAAVRMAEQAAKETGNSRIVLSGGSFQNQYIMRRLPGQLGKAGLEPYWHRRVSCNDEGLSLGQMMIADAGLKR